MKSASKFMSPALASFVLAFQFGSSFLFAQSSNQQTDPFADQQLEYFENKVRPLFVKHCYSCHGPEAKPIKGGFSMATRTRLLSGGDTGPAIVPGDAQQSLLVDAINYGELYEMPPEGKLSKDEIAVISQWVNAGAAWPTAERGEHDSQSKAFDVNERKDAHWCWQPIESPTIPNVKNQSWVNNSIDNFVLRKLEQAGIEPAPQATRRNLIRRAYFDFIGLPPSPEQMQAFVDDADPNAFEKVVDALLVSPQFGERWAQHWLDLARYAESYGHQYDYNIAHAYQYRDYLIRAFNDDVSYKQLIHEHVAGDLLEDPRRNQLEDFNESILATAFWYLGQAKPSAVDSRANEADLIDDRIDTMSKTFLGLTIACARCHDHKFDAISTSDYYALSGFFQSSRRQLSMLDPNRKIERSFKIANQMVLEGDKLAAVFTKQLATADPAVLTKYLDASIDVLRKSKSDDTDEDDSIGSIGNGKELDSVTLARLVKILASQESKKLSHPLHLIRQAIDSNDGVNSGFARRISTESMRAIKAEQSWIKGSVLFADFENGLPAGWFRTGVAFEDTLTASSKVRYAATNGSVNHTGAITSGRFGREFYGVIRSPTFRLDDPMISYRVRGNDVTIRLIIDGFFMDEHRNLLFRNARFKIKPSAEYAWQTQAGDLKNHLGSMAHIEIIDHGNGFVAVDEIRFSKTEKPPERSVFTNKALTDPRNYLDQIALCRLVAESSVNVLRNPTSAGFSDLASWMLEERLLRSLGLPNEPSQSDAPNDLVSIAGKLNALRKRVNQSTARTPRPMMAVGITDGTGEDERIFIRGNHENLGDVVQRRFLSAISDRAFDLPQGSGRLLLAKKITAKDNPLTARVAVNRVWHHLFGRGIVESVDNFGMLGKQPTHPDLLDHLAIDFVDSDWSVKNLIRQIALSRTYQMASTANDHASSIDPNNGLFHRSSVRRLEAEAIRDSILKVSGHLNMKMYGAPVPVHLTSFMTGRGRPKKSGPVDGNGRRTIYVAVRRNFMSPMKLAFDAPVPLSTTGRRNRSNVPAQALIMMNSPFVNQQAKVWAERLTKKKQTIQARVETIYLEGLGRPPLESEIDKAIEFLTSLANDLEIKEADASGSVELWQEYCHIVFNLKEFIFLN